MKKFTSILTMVLLAALPMVFTSCEEDDESIAYRLDGVWYGQIASEYFTYRYGGVTEYTDVMFEFWSDNYSYASGRGREVDYYGRYVSDVARFDYEVVDGIIYLYYDDGSRIAIHRYSLFGNEFRGESARKISRLLPRIVQPGARLQRMGQPLLLHQEGRRVGR